jgi:transposase
MTTKATRNAQDTTSEGTLFVAVELREKTGKLGFTTGPGQRPRERSGTARDQQRVLDEIAQAKRRFDLPETAPVVSCYEAGREGFWLPRFLEAHGLTTQVVDSAAMAVSRRQRRAKSDGVDVRKFLNMLIRYEQGERQVWQVVHVPSVEAEDQRHRHRDLETLKRERASTTARIKGVLSRQGIQGTSWTKLPEHLEALRRWDGSPLPPGLRQRVLRVYAHHPFRSEQIAAVEAGSVAPCFTTQPPPVATRFASECLSLSRFMIYYASNERRSHTWPVYDLPMCSLVLRSFWILPV